MFSFQKRHSSATPSPVAHITKPEVEEDTFLPNPPAKGVASTSAAQTAAAAASGSITDAFIRVDLAPGSSSLNSFVHTIGYLDTVFRRPSLWCCHGSLHGLRWCVTTFFHHLPYTSDAPPAPKSSSVVVNGPAHKIFQRIQLNHSMSISSFTIVFTWNPMRPNGD